MIDVEQAITDKFPGFSEKPKLLQKSAIGFLKKLTHEDEINDFLIAHQDIMGFDFIEAVFDYFDFTYSTTFKDKQNIPAEGRVVVFANHPIGSLDGLALLRQIGEVRSDVKIIANDMLMMFPQLKDLLIPVNNMTGKSFKDFYHRVTDALNQEQAVIVFPAGEVSRTSPTGIKDGRWRFGFVNFARKTQSPILPIHVKGKNSALFYSVSLFAKPLSTAMLAREMFKQRNRTLNFTIGDLIPHSELETDQVSDKALVGRLKKHLYKLPKIAKAKKQGVLKNKSTFATEKSIAHPEERQSLVADINNSNCIGETLDGQKIVVAEFSQAKSLVKEIGRMREITFRKVGEGSGRKRDLDRYDKYYSHLALWNDKKLELAGAYRIGNCKEILTERGIDSLYTYELFNFEPGMNAYLEQGLELGRSFVSPNYWGKSSLDYLWQGVGKFAASNPNARYMIGPVSMSDRFPHGLRNKLIYYFTKFYAGNEVLAKPKHPYPMTEAEKLEMDCEFADLDQKQGMNFLLNEFKGAGYKFPVLFKQYASLFEEGGFRILTFSIDPDFGNCIDGLILADLEKMKESKKKRYLK